MKSAGCSKRIGEENMVSEVSLRRKHLSWELNLGRQPQNKGREHTMQRSNVGTGPERGNGWWRIRNQKREGQCRWIKQSPAEW